MKHIKIYLDNIIPFSRLMKNKSFKYNYLVFILSLVIYFLILNLEIFPQHTDIIDTSASSFELLGSDSGPLLNYDLLKIFISGSFVFLIIFSFVIDIFDSVYNKHGKPLYDDISEDNPKRIMQSIISMVFIYFSRIIIFNLSILFGYVSLNNINVIKYGVSVFHNYDKIENVSSLMNILLTSFKFPLSNYNVFPPLNLISIITVLFFSLSTILVWTFLTGSFYFVLTALNIKIDETR